MKKDKFDLLKLLEDSVTQLDEIFGGSEFLDEPISLLWGLIEDEYGTGHENDDVATALGEFGAGKISKSKLIKILEKNKLR